MLSLALATSLFLGPVWSHLSVRATPSFEDVCHQIQGAISNASAVYWLGSTLYNKGVEHYMTSSEQDSACVVEPGTAEDVGAVLKIVGSNRTPFAVKGGGHTGNPGYSSTEGIQIAMFRFSEVTYDESAQTATIGTGLIWDNVYEALAPHNVNVVGGRVTGVGVGGFTLGGGYSWLTNQYGLTVDTLTSFELVKTDGTIVTVTDSSDADLFWALKGGLNNYGIVTRFTLKTFPQGQVWGGLITYTASHLEDVAAAVAKFSANVTDPKAAIITASNFLLTQPGVSQLLFYDGPTPPDGIFNDFLDIPHFTEDVDTRDFISLVQASPANLTAGQRSVGIFATVPVPTLSANVINAMFNETVFWGHKLQLDSGTFISYDIEHFLPSILTHNTSPSAWPPTRDTAYIPQFIYYAWLFEFEDEKFYDAIRQSSAQIANVAKQEGQKGVDDAPPYPNYAIFDTPVELIYGDSLPRMRSIKATVDPDNVMGLAGGIKI
ncbi:FAD-binding domain-containing protein [Dendrothele bispora CBS 962.96]|uniref:FAD-binding domain-containing protein n=1 Tax=Dendrothele bispora (strain CBS 962.96) TaxID=1314807 RepID=A0A4S8L5W8_DENBC|nr:FAD-binding domain-containing protein [Dendrothele bispora CBS 962.96]